MVIVRFMGGLGNQMFQYAIGRALSGEKKVYYDLSFLTKNRISSELFTARTFELNIFSNLRLKKMNPYFLRFLQSESDRYKFIKRFFPSELHTLKLVTDENISSLLSTPINDDWLYLDGYFQNPVYFNHIRLTLLRAFEFPALSESVKPKRNRILQCNSVSIHIRRGDYLKPKISEFHGVLPISYYKNAVEYINKNVPNPTYFIFSDDLIWCKENLSFINDATYISCDGPAWQDMKLMSLCKHNVIANSSFSWWGAWLNKNSDKIVIAPKKWFTGVEINIVPNEWVAL